MNGNAIALAKQRLAQRRGIPQGAYSGAMAGQMPAQYNQGYGVPQGAEYGSMGECGPYGNCPAPVMAPNWGPNSNSMPPFTQPGSIIGVQANPTAFTQFCLSITCGNKFFYGCGARSFTPPNQLVVTSVMSGFNGIDRTCGPDAGFDVAYWNTDDCYCPFDWGCFSNLAPLTICFDPIDTLSVLPFLNMVIVGNAMNLFNDCWPMFPPGYGGGPGGTPGGGNNYPGGGPGSFQGPGGMPGSGVLG